MSIARCATTAPSKPPSTACRLARNSTTTSATTSTNRSSTRCSRKGTHDRRSRRRSEAQEIGRALRVTAGNTALCTVGRTGNDLHYRGYDILDIADTCEFEEVAYLLVHGKLPTVEIGRAHV